LLIGVEQPKPIKACGDVFAVETKIFRAHDGLHIFSLQFVSKDRLDSFAEIVGGVGIVPGDGIAIKPFDVSSGAEGLGDISSDALHFFFA